MGLARAIRSFADAEMLERALRLNTAELAARCAELAEAVGFGRKVLIAVAWKRDRVIQRSPRSNPATSENSDTFVARRAVFRSQVRPVLDAELERSSLFSAGESVIQSERPSEQRYAGH